MNGSTSSGYLVIGDISGYTSYVAQTELEHSQAVLTELLELIVRRFRPMLTLAKLEGDAVFAHAPEAQVPRGESLLDLVESTYVAFKNRVDGIVMHTTCQCNACRAIPTLDLKFMLHFGDYVIQRVSGIGELVGSDVNLLHRLTKNHVSQETGWNAYALFTEKCLEHIGVPPDGMHEQIETYEHLGAVQTYSLDLHRRYSELTEARAVYIGPDEAHSSHTYKFAAPAQLVWEWMTNPEKRNLFADGQNWSAVSRPGGRTAAGASNHCAHGKDALSVETIMDWRPYDYYTVESRGEIEKETFTDAVQTFEFVPSADGKETTLHTYAKLNRPGIAGKLAYKVFGRIMTKAYRRAEVMMLEEMAQRASMQAGVEVEIPAIGTGSA